MAETSTTPATRGDPPVWSLGDRLARARKSAGIRSGEMGDRLGVTRTSIGNWEAGRHVPSAVVLRVWAEETGVPLWWLRGDDPETVFRARDLTLPPGQTDHVECAGQLTLTPADGTTVAYAEAA